MKPFACRHLLSFSSAMRENGEARWKVLNVFSALPSFYLLRALLPPAAPSCRSLLRTKHSKQYACVSLSLSIFSRSVSPNLSQHHSYFQHVQGDRSFKRNTSCAYCYQLDNALCTSQTDCNVRQHTSISCCATPSRLSTPQTLAPPPRLITALPPQHSPPRCLIPTRGTLPTAGCRPMSFALVGN